MRTRDQVSGSMFFYREDGAAVARMLELVSCVPDFPDHDLLALYRFGSSVRVVRYGRALRAVKDVVAKKVRNPDQRALHSLRIGGATTLASGVDISEREGYSGKGGGDVMRTRRTRGIT